MSNLYSHLEFLRGSCGLCNWLSLSWLLPTCLLHVCPTFGYVVLKVGRKSWTETVFYCFLQLCIISYHLFADADTGIYPHAASQYHLRPKAKRGIAWIYSRIRGSKQRVTNPSHAQTMFVTTVNIAAALKPQLSLLSGLNHRIHSVLLGRIVAARKVDGGRDRRLIAIVTSSMTFPFFYIPRWWRQTLNTCYTSRLSANQKRGSAPSMG